MAKKQVQIIAEAGVNHNGSIDLALELIDKAVDVGADVIKFQTFKAKKLATSKAIKADYQLNVTAEDESQVAMLQKLELSDSDHQILFKHCADKKISFLSSPFDVDSVDLLAHTFNLKTIKLGSGEITNAPLLLHVARTGCDVIMSTGMASLGEIESALGVLAFGYLTDSGANAGISEFQRAYNSQAGHDILQKRVSLLLCTTEYPAPFDEIDLRAMDTLRLAFELNTGFSDHTPGIAVPIAAVARGATIIEKHFTVDNNLPGPDHKASLEPTAFAAMVAGIRQVESAIGSSRKVLHPAEAKNVAVVRKSLVAAKPIQKGELFSEENIVSMRVAAGVSPIHYWDVLGRVALADYEQGDLIQL